MSPDVGAGDAWAEALAAAVTLLGAPDIARCVLGSDVHPSVI